MSDAVDVAFIFILKSEGKKSKVFQTPALYIEIKYVQVFLDISWDMAEETETTEHAESIALVYPHGMGRELLRIFVKCISDKSTYGHAVSERRRHCYRQKRCSTYCEWGVLLAPEACKG